MTLIKNNISQELVEKLSLDFDPLFSKIRIYGTVEKPLFMAVDVEKLLGISDLNIRHREFFEENIHYTKEKVPTYKGLKESILLTELGLYQALFQSSMPIAYKYCEFIVQVMSSLRTNESISLAGELEKFKRENAKLEYTTDVQHQRIETLEAELGYETQLATEFKEKLDTKPEPGAPADKDKLADLLSKKYLTNVYLMVEDEYTNDYDTVQYTISTRKDKNLHIMDQIGMVDPKNQIPDIETYTSLDSLKDSIYKSNITELQN